MTTREVAGKTIHFDEQGFMSNATEWDRAVATALAEEIKLPPLTPLPPLTTAPCEVVSSSLLMCRT